MSSRSYYFISLIIILSGCSGDVSRENQNNDGKIKEHLVNANRIFVENESEQIDSWINRHHLEMGNSGTGLRYKIFTKGKKNRVPIPGDSVLVDFVVDLLDGSSCYNTENKPVMFAVGKAEMPRGMDEAIQMMKEEDSCVIVLPSHLAYGFTGDGDRIPGNTATVYYFTLKKILEQ